VIALLAALIGGCATASVASEQVPEAGAERHVVRVVEGPFTVTLRGLPADVVVRSNAETEGWDTMHTVFDGFLDWLLILELEIPCELHADEAAGCPADTRPWEGPCPDEVTLLASARPEEPASPEDPGAIRVPCAGLEAGSVVLSFKPARTLYGDRLEEFVRVGAEGLVVARAFMLADSSARLRDIAIGALCGMTLVIDAPAATPR